MTCVPPARNRFKGLVSIGPVGVGLKEFCPSPLLELGLNYLSLPPLYPSRNRVQGLVYASLTLGRNMVKGLVSVPPPPQIGIGLKYLCLPPPPSDGEIM